jgi:phage/plasmid-like protein (TIGR03299 family)
MSQETMQWLNLNTLIGFTDQRGTAWHYRAVEQGQENNHYSGAIPVEDVRRRLFPWEAVEGTVESTVLLPEGVLTIKDDERKTVVRPDTGQILGVFKKGYEIHQYDEWLVKNVESILDDDLSIGSAGLLKKGAVAWVSVEVPDTITTPEGVAFRPNLLAATSLDGSLATTYKRVVTNTVCDNTMSAALGEHGQQIKIKHSRYSKVKLGEARAALEIMHTIAEDFAAEVARLTAITITPPQWAKFVDVVSPLKDIKGEAKTGRALTLAQNKQDALNKLWNSDPRVSPWAGTAWGVVQAMNTAEHHVFTVKGERAERNMLRAVTGKVDALDAETKTTLAAVIA